jgi:hypothetical protein
MQYLIIPDKFYPTHTAPDGSPVRVEQYPDDRRISAPWPVHRDLTGYTVLPAPTPAEKKAAVAAQQLDLAMQWKLAALEQAYEDDLARGVSVPFAAGDPPGNETLVLAAGDADQVRFTQGCVILNTAELVATDQAAFRAANISTVFGRKVADAAGNQFDMTVTQYRQLAVAYAQAIGTKQTVLMTKIAAVKSATSIDQVNAVQVSP